MSETPSRWLSGPLARFAAGFGVGWLLLAVLMVVLRIPAGLWVLTAIVCVVLGIATLVIGYRSLVRVESDGLHVPGTGKLAWSDIDSVRLAPMEGGWVPLVDYADGRALKVVALDGLMGRRPEGRVRTQAEAVAAGAGKQLSVMSAQSAQAKPSRAA